MKASSWCSELHTDIVLISCHSLQVTSQRPETDHYNSNIVSVYSCHLDNVSSIFRDPGRMKRSPLPSALKAGANKLPCSVSHTDQAIITFKGHMQETITNEFYTDRFPQMYFHQHGSEQNEILRPTSWAIRLESLDNALHTQIPSAATRRSHGRRSPTPEPHDWVHALKEPVPVQFVKLCTQRCARNGHLSIWAFSIISIFLRQDHQTFIV